MGIAPSRRLAGGDVARDVAVTDADVQLGEPFSALPPDPLLPGIPEYF